MAVDRAPLGALLRGLRERALLTQEELALRSGLSAGTVRGIEAGRIRQPRTGSVRLLAEALSLSDEDRRRLVAFARAEPVPESAPAADRPPVPAQLPADVSGFHGRSAEGKELDALADPAGSGSAPALAVLAGSAGVGKTALAVHWAHRARPWFPDGQLYLNAQGYLPGERVTPARALAGFLGGLGVPADRIPADVTAAASLYRSLLADKRVLVLLDNVSSADQVRPLLPAGPGSLVLVTSRDRLAGLVALDGACLITLDVLEPAEARGLIAHVTGAQRAGAEPSAVDELARLCGYLPLALRIAAANLVGQPRLTVADYAARLERGSRLTLLTVEGDDQAAVRVAFDHSYATLPHPARRLFRLLGVAPGGDVTAPAVAALAGIPVADGERELDRLAAAHLVQENAPGRYSCHDLLRLYAAGRATGEDPDEARRAAVERLIRWYLATAASAARLLYPDRRARPGTEAPGPFDDHRATLAWLTAERANLVSAARHAAEHGPYPVAWQLADALQRFFWNGGDPVDWLAVAQAGLAAARADGELAAQAVARSNLGSLHWRQGALEVAAGHYRDAVELARRAGRDDLEADALGGLGAVCRRAGRPGEAATLLARALTLNRAAGRLEPSNVGRLGSVYWEMGRLREAAAHHAGAYAMYRAMGSLGGQAIALANLGETSYLLGDRRRAAHRLNRALRLYRAIGNRDGEADALCGLARIRSDAGRPGPARELAQAALVLAREVGGDGSMAQVLNTVGAVLYRAGRPGPAAARYREGLRLARAGGHLHPEAEALIGLAVTGRKLDRLDDARAAAVQAVTITVRTGYRVLEYQARLALADILRAAGAPGAASGEARWARRLRRSTGHRTA